MTNLRKPLLMGLLMGPMMMWMLHGALTGDGPKGVALIAFVAAHVLLAVVILLGAIFAARLSQRMRHLLSRVHRPRLSHVAAMLTSAMAAAAGVHFAIHGVT